MGHTLSPALGVRVERSALVRGENPTAVAPDPPEVLLAFERISRGDRRALDELFERHHSFLVALVRRHLQAGVTSRLDVADVVQEVELEAFSRLPDYLERRPMPFCIWLRRTALERLRKIHRFHLDVERRAVARERSLRTGVDEACGQHLLVRFPCPVERAVQHELTDRVRIQLSGVSPTDQEIIHLRLQEGRTNAEAAQRLGIPAETAKKRYSRALRRLRERLLEAHRE
jgi:RNA polymerase sigma-70 factor, ECF subfamily